MTIKRRLLMGGGAVAALAGGVWAYQRLTYDSRYVSIDIRFGGVNREFGLSGATLPVHGTFDIGLGYFDIAIAARAEGLMVEIKRSTHELSWPGDLVFYTLDTTILVPITGDEESAAIYDTTKPDADGGEGHYFVGNLYLTAHFQEFM